MFQLPQPVHSRSATAQRGCGGSAAPQAELGDSWFAISDELRIPGCCIVAAEDSLLRKVGCHAHCSQRAQYDGMRWVGCIFGQLWNTLFPG